MYDFKYMAVLDTDELLVPSVAYDLQEMLDVYERSFPGFTSVNFESVFYPPVEITSFEPTR